jgi:GGDEF domain-containing protein
MLVSDTSESNRFTMRQKKLLYAPSGKEPRGIVQPKPRISQSGTKDVLAEPLDTHTTRGNKTKKNGEPNELQLSPEAEVFRQIARMITDDHGSLSAYVAEFMKHFSFARRCTIYIDPAEIREVQKDDSDDPNQEDKEEKRVLGHRLTVVQTKKGEFKTRNVDDTHTITDRRSIEFKTLSEARPSVFDFDQGIRVVFNNLDRRNRRYKHYRNYKQGRKREMMAYVPMQYRTGSRVGVMVLEGHLGVVGCDYFGIEKPAFSLGVSTSAGAQIAFQLMHKFDGVTELKRRKDFEIELEAVIKKLQKKKKQKEEKLQSAYVLLIDLDNFKDINDKFDHLKGDEVLNKVAMNILDTLRTEEEDAPEEKRELTDAWSPDKVARWGGEEFVVLLSGDVSQEHARKIAKRINENLAALSDDEIKVSASIGIVEVGLVLNHFKCKGVKQSRRKVFKICDKLMYQAKKGGKNRTYSLELVNGKLKEVEYKNGSS